MTKMLAPFVLVLLLLTAVGLYSLFVFFARKSAYASGPPLRSRTEIAFCVDAEFTPDERALVLETFGRIRMASGCVDLKASFEDIGFGEVFSWRRDDRATIYRGSNPFTWKYNVSRYLAGSGLYMGIAIVKTGDIFIMASRGDENFIDFRNAVTHEILHVLFNSGWHSPDENSLMYRSIGGGKQRLLGPEIAKLRAMCATRRRKP
jgi:hypothetical protein